MSCFHPITAWKYPPGFVSSRGKSILFNDPCDSKFTEIKIPCGKCLGCQISKSRDWALRCMHESSLHEVNCFVTLTYEKSPISLRPRDFQLFMKKLRKRVGSVRFFQCGEYGDITFRPHHHVLLFGWRPEDLSVYGNSIAGYTYSSNFLDNCWGHGKTVVGDVTFASAAYVSRYILKKQLFKDKERSYYDRSIHQLVQRDCPSIIPPYITMSRRPGIGSDWIKSFSSDVFSKGYVTFDSGQRAPPSRFYKEFFKKIDSESYELYKDKCLKYFLDHPELSDPKRLMDSEFILQQKVERLKRCLDVD